jgi:hypothetical protein
VNLLILAADTTGFVLSEIQCFKAQNEISYGQPLNRSGASNQIAAYVTGKRKPIEEVYGKIEGVRRGTIER